VMGTHKALRILAVIDASFDVSGMSSNVIYSEAIRVMHLHRTCQTVSHGWYAISSFSMSLPESDVDVAYSGSKTDGGGTRA